MAKNNSRLGKGLNELMASVAMHMPVASPAQGAAVAEAVVANSSVVASQLDVGLKSGLKSIPIENIKPGPFQPRLGFDQEGVSQLAESMKTQGVLQPILVRHKTGDKYEIIAGERRWRAAALAGIHMIPAIVKEMTDHTAYAVALIENIQRENLNPIEEARGMKRLADEVSLTHLQVAEAVGKSRTSVTNLLRLLSLNDDVQTLLEQGKIDMGHARALLGIKGAIQSQVAQTVVGRGLSVRETERLVSRLQDDAFASSNEVKKSEDPNIKRLQQDLAEKLGAAVKISHSGRNGQGMLVIRYNDVDQLEGILSHFK